MRAAVSAFGLALLLAAKVASAQVIPDYYSEPGPNPQRQQLDQNGVEFIDPFSGALLLDYTDIRIPGNGGLALEVRRTYKTVQFDREFSTWRRSVNGLGWTIHFGRVLNSNASVCTHSSDTTLADNPVIELPDGSRHILYKAVAIPGVSPTPLWISTSRWKAECDLSLPTLGLIVMSPEGVQYTMNKREDRYALNGTYSWYATQIKDRNNNTISISYTDDPQGYKLISQVTSSDGRLITFQHTGAGTPDVRLASITANGFTWTYNYTKIPTSELAGDFWQLTSVVRPDGSGWSHAYNGRIPTSPGSYEMQRVTYPHGGTTDYSYGNAFVNFDACTGACANNTVVTQKVTGGSSITPGTWTFAYSPDWNNSVTGDQTTVTTPSGSIVYNHFGFTTAVQGTMWKIGLLQKKETFNGSTLIQTEQLTWAPQVVSDEDYVRPSRSTVIRDLQTSAALLTQRSVTRDGTAYTTAYLNHDSFGNPRTVVESGNASRTTTLTYHLNAAKWIVKQLEDETITGIGMIDRSFDANGNLSSESRYGVTTTYLRYATGDLQRVTNARNFFTTYGTYKRGIALTENQPEGRNLIRTVDDAGNISSETDGEGHATSYTYDGLNRLTGIVHPINVAVTINWGPNSLCNGNRAKDHVRGAFREIVCFDGYGRPIDVERRNGAGTISIVQTLAYDASGRKSFESYPGSSGGTSFAYDALDRLTFTTDPSTAIKTFAYLSGNRVQVTNERGKVSTYTYRSFGDPERKAMTAIGVSVAGANIAIQRNLLDQVTQVTQGSTTWTYVYDTRFFLTSLTQPETGMTLFGRDAVGNMSTRQVGTSGLTTYTYDGLNRLTFINYPDTRDVQQEWDRNSRLTVLKTLNVDGNPVTVRSYAYDPNGNLATETLVRDTLTFSVQYAYNGRDQLDTVTYPSGLVVDYSPDALGRPIQVLPNAPSVSFHPSGQPAFIQFANGAQTEFTFNPRHLPTKLIHRNGQLAPITDSTYTWDPARNLGSVDDAVDNTFDRTLGYDDIDRLVQADAPSGWGTTAIAYDGRGNITSQNFGPAGSLTYTYDAASNRLTGVSGNRNLTLSYDVYGNVIGNGEANFTYDDGSRLRCYRCGTPDQIDYDVDGKGMRVRASKASGLTYSFYAKDGRLLFEYSAADGYFDYVYLLDKLIAKRWATGTIHYHNDLLGSPIAATDGGGNLMWKENYRAWGRPTLITGQSTSSLWYTGAPYDHGTKLSYLGARWYDVVLGRFMGVDPAPFDETNLHSLNRYAYGNNNPFKFKDPGGTWALPAIAVGGVAALVIGGGYYSMKMPPNTSGGFASSQINGAPSGFVTGAVQGLVDAVKDPGGFAAWVGSRLDGLIFNQSPQIDPKDVAGKTPSEIDRLAREKGLHPKGPDPQGGRGAYIDPVTGQQRILIHPGDQGCTPHCHVNDASGRRLDVSGNVVPPESPPAHLPLRTP